ncbi:MAG: MopE-related protein [Myxococcota bacterium]|nr:MopE-related protein [Myxococcota bacterium]
MSGSKGSMVWLWIAVAASAAGCGAEAMPPDLRDVPNEVPEGGDGCRFNNEECNGLDDDCDGLTDEGYDLDSDPMHCGRCNNRCRFLNADALCVEGTCRLGPCRTDYYDVNGEPGDGCEYRCIRTRDAEDDWRLCNDSIDNDCDGMLDGADPDCRCVPEVCNYLDDDCDELIDEDFDLSSDPLNCNECGTVCPTRWHASTPICVGGGCNFVCDLGWINANGWPDDGCEARCTPTGTPDDDCDDQDDNCDGVLNEGFTSVTCSVGVGGPDCAGTTACRLTGSGYAEICDVGREVPAEDTICDLYDEDCDGSTDEDYHGVPCGIGVCRSFALCVGGVEGACVPGAPTSPTDRLCDGLDEDCDGLTDEEYTPTICGTGVCMRTSICIPGIGEYCTPGIPEPTERCDGLDNDCDTLTDEDLACAVGAIQACTVTVPSKTCAGEQRCTASCAWGACTVVAAPDTVETCNSIDDDCDGTVDEPPAPPATICPPGAHGTTGCSGGTCMMASCDDGWGDVNGSVTDGCECAVESPDVPNACGTARTLGTFPDTGWDVTVTGKLGSATDVDCYSLSAPDSADTTCDDYHVDIRFTANPGSQFAITVYRGDCATVVCSAETSTYDWYTNYTSGSGTTARGECPCRAANTYGYTTCNDDSRSYYFCVSRLTGFPPRCDAYSIRVTNGVF